VEKEMGGRLLSAAPGNDHHLIVFRQGDPRPDSAGTAGSGATLKGKEIYEATRGAPFLTITLRDKDETPWRGASLYSKHTFLRGKGQTGGWVA